MMKPTIILVHGAFAESASWNGVIDPLLAAGHRVIAAPNPLRSLSGDAAAITDLVRSVDGPAVLVGHSYGGAVITNVRADSGEISALVYVAAFALDAGESVATIGGQFPGSTLGETLQPVPLSDGTTDVYIAADRFHGQFCADVPAPQAALMSATQRPVTQEALGEPSGDRPLWREVPSWFVFGTADRNIPVAELRFMAQRAEARQTVEIAEASHACAVSQPEAVANVILEAATAFAVT